MTASEKTPATTREMWLELGLLLAGIAAVRLAMVFVGGVPGLLIAAVGFGLLIAFYLRCGVWAERVVRRKGVYHPQYFVLGPLGLVMALVARRR